jgi:hypothetical protein
LDDWGRFVFDIVVLTCALLAAFEGARRIAKGKMTRGAMLLIAAGVLVSAAKSGIALYVANDLDELAHSEERLPMGELPETWGANSPPAEREKGSIAHAGVAFTATGTLLRHFGPSGERKLFVPTQDHLRRRDETVQLKTQMELTAEHLRTQAVRWPASLLVALLFGVYVGRRNDG